MRIVNRKALYEYKILEKFEFGIVLIGAEIKSIRMHKVSIKNAHVGYSFPHVYIYGMHIGANEYAKGIDEERKRILLVKKKEKNKLIAISKEPGKTAVPLELYYNKKGFVKLQCAIAQGRTKFDKRAVLKEREWKKLKKTIT